MLKIISHGSVPLFGTVEPVRNKNAVIQMLLLAIATDSMMTYRNIQQTSDVQCILDEFKRLGMEVHVDGTTVRICAKRIYSYELSYEFCSKVRIGVNFVPLLLSRFGKAIFYEPGGCTLGSRGIGTHTKLYEDAGCTVTKEPMEDRTKVIIERDPDKEIPGVLWLAEQSVTATIAAIVLLALQKNTSRHLKQDHVILNAACEPHIKEVCSLLSKMGANVKITPEPVNLYRVGAAHEPLFGVEVEPLEDFIDVLGLSGLAVITRGKIEIGMINDEYAFMNIKNILNLLGIHWSYEDKFLIVNGTKKPSMNLDTVPEYKTGIPKWVSGPWPNLPADYFPLLPIMALRYDQQIFIDHWMYETPFQHIPQLSSAGVQFQVIGQNKVLMDPTRSRFAAKAELKAPSIIEASKALLYFMLGFCKKGGVLEAADPILRRYADMESVLKRLGAQVEFQQV